MLGLLDDRSRVACHLQWYLDETAETLVHGLTQAIQKRGLPRALLTDNGAAMLAAGFSAADVEKVLFYNPIEFYAQSGQISVDDVVPLKRNQTLLWEENSVLRGQPPVVEQA